MGSCFTSQQSADDSVDSFPLLHKCKVGESIRHFQQLIRHYMTMCSLNAYMQEQEVVWVYDMVTNVLMRAYDERSGCYSSCWCPSSFVWALWIFLGLQSFFILYPNQTHRILLGEKRQYNSQVHMCHFLCACLWWWVLWVCEFINQPHTVTIRSLDLIQIPGLLYVARCYLDVCVYVHLCPYICKI